MLLEIYTHLVGGGDVSWWSDEALLVPLVFFAVSSDPGNPNLRLRWRSSFSCIICFSISMNIFQVLKSRKKIVVSSGEEFWGEAEKTWKDGLWVVRNSLMNGMSFIGLLGLDKLFSLCMNFRTRNTQPPRAFRTTLPVTVIIHHTVFYFFCRILFWWLNKRLIYS